jgi:hypothetical protein
MSLVKPINLLYGKLASGQYIDFKGAVLQLNATGTVQKAAAGARPLGIALKTTEDPLNPGTYLSGVEVAYVREGIVEVAYHLTSSDANIGVGDLVSTKGANSAGTVKKHVPTSWPGTYSNTTAATIINELGMIVGIALEAVTAPSSGDKKGTLKVLLTLHPTVSA